MSPADASISAAALRWHQADAALAAALRVAALAWERERATADALALRVAEAERFLRISSGQLPVDPEPG